MTRVFYNYIQKKAVHRSRRATHERDRIETGAYGNVAERFFLFPVFHRAFSVTQRTHQLAV